jgi:hypothetical protein
LGLISAMMSVVSPFCAFTESQTTILLMNGSSPGYLPGQS